MYIIIYYILYIIYYILYIIYYILYIILYIIYYILYIIYYIIYILYIYVYIYIIINIYIYIGVCHGLSENIVARNPLINIIKLSPSKWKKQAVDSPIFRPSQIFCRNLGWGECFVVCFGSKSPETLFFLGISNVLIKLKFYSSSLIWRCVQRRDLWILHIR